MPQITYRGMSMEEALGRRSMGGPFDAIKRAAAQAQRTVATGLNVPLAAAYGAERPWYKRPIVWIGGAAIVGIGAWLLLGGRKKGR
jgi:hypothetical protein